MHVHIALILTCASFLEKNDRVWPTQNNENAPLHFLHSKNPSYYTIPWTYFFGAQVTYFCIL
jgi:hypothetical protein